MDLKELQARVRRSHDLHFGHTELPERIRDLQHQIAELAYHRDSDHLGHELGDAAWAILQLCNEQKLDLATLVDATIARLDARSTGHQIALIGTSANPITFAHLTMGLELLALTDVDQVWYYLAGKHPWGKALMPAHHRVEMVRRATAPYARLKVCDFEVVHGDAIYQKTHETAEILRDFLLPAWPEYRFCWVMGSDVAQTFDRWGGADWMAEHLRVFVIHRLGYDFDKANSPIADPRHVYLKDGIVTSNISSTLVRNRGKDYDEDKLRALLPPAVWDYLVEHRLLDDGVLAP